MSVSLRRLGIAAVAAAVLSAGCGSMAWLETPAVPGECILAAPMQIDSLAAAVRGTTGTIEGIVPRFEIIAGISLLAMGEKYAGLEGPSPNTLVSWSQMFDRGTGFDVQIVLRRPPRAATSLATGDTLVILRGTLESYSGKPYAAGTPDGLTILGGWLEGRTLLNALDAGKSLRPYLQYGGGVMLYSATTVNGIVHWESTMALGWRTALGLELRKGRIGVYVEGGIQVIGPPNVDATILASDEIDMRTAQDMVTYPIRFGAIIGF